MKISTIIDKVRLPIMLLLCFGLYMTQLVFIRTFAVNIPYWDEWEFLGPGGLFSNQTIGQLFALHNEHRIVTTKLLTLFLYYTDSWNIVNHQLINFALYGILIVTVACFVKKAVPQLAGWVLLCFTLFLLSDISSENHFWAFQSQFHFALIFLFLSITFLFDEKQDLRRLVPGVLFSFLTTYSFSSGLVQSLVVLFGYICFKLFRIRKAPEKRGEILQLIVVTALIGGSISCYFIGFAANPEHPPFTYPFQPIFWTYFFNLLSGGFGFKSASVIPGSLLFSFALVPVIGEIWKCRNDISADKWKIFIGILAVFGALASITLGRAGFGLAQAKSSRYSEIVIMLIPLSIAAWTIFLISAKRFRTYLLIGFWLFCAVGFSRSFRYRSTYRDWARERQSGAQCVKNYYESGGDAKCLTMYPVALVDHLEFAKRSKISFSSEMDNAAPQSPK